MSARSTGRGYQLCVSFRPREADSGRAALVALTGPHGCVRWWGYSAPDAAEPAMLQSAGPWEGPAVGAWARCLEVASVRWPDRAAVGDYVDVSVYEAVPEQGELDVMETADVVEGCSTSSTSGTPLVLREHFVGQRTPDGLDISFADETSYVELLVPINIALEDLEPGPLALIAQAVCAIEAELVHELLAPRTVRRARTLGFTRQSKRSKRSKRRDCAQVSAAPQDSDWPAGHRVLSATGSHIQDQWGAGLRATQASLDASPQPSTERRWPNLRTLHLAFQWVISHRYSVLLT